MKKNKTTLLSIFLIFAYQLLFAQIDHFETIVYETDTWNYRLAVSEPPVDWMSKDFDDSNWQTGIGGFGYADNDDNTIVNSLNGVYLRIDFEIVDIEEIETLLIDADYDDGFIAYINGTPVARSLIIGDPPTYNSSTTTDHEAVLYQGGIPERYVVNKDILQNGSNTFAIQVANFGTDSSDMSARFFLSAAINQQTFHYGEVPDWFNTNIPEVFTSSNLPIFVINTNNQPIVNDPRIVAQMGIINNGEENRNFLTDPFNEYDGRIEIETHGNSSQFFEKKNYRIETQTENGENNNVPLLGMPEENDWILHGPYSDKSLLRNVLSYHLGSLTERWAPRTAFCELIINGDYKGLYVLTEKIKRDKNRLDIANVRPEDTEGDELTGDYLFRIDWANDAVDADGWTSFNGDHPFNYGYVEPNFKDIQPEQKEYLINHIATFEDALLASDYQETYKDYIDVESLVDYFLINELAKHIDAFKLSFYMYKEKDSKGGKINFGPIWDFNLGYGNYDYVCDNSPNDWIYPCTAVPTWFDRIIEIDEVQDRIYCRWKELRSTVLDPNEVINFINSQADLLDEAQQRNFNRYPVLDQYLWPNSYIGGTYENEINFLRNFMLLRIRWMDENIQLVDVSSCDQLTSIKNIDTDVVVSAYPNPVINELNFKYSSSTIERPILYIYSVNGRLVHQEQLTNQINHSINTQNWQNGLYIYNISKEDKILSYGSIIK